MGLEDGYDNIDIGESGGEKSQETTKEAQERKEKASKSMAGIQRTRKDEKKATKDNDYLYEVIIEVLRNKDYDILLPFISDMLKEGIPANFILGGLSLVYNQAAYIIRTNYIPGNDKMVYDKESAKNYNITVDYTPSLEMIDFNDSDIDTAIKKRINEWIEDIISVISFDPSTIMTDKFLKLTQKGDNKKLLINYIASILTFFMFRLNIMITKEKAMLYSEFILTEAIKKLRTLQLEQIDFD